MKNFYVTLKNLDNLCPWTFNKMPSPPQSLKHILFASFMLLTVAVLSQTETEPNNTIATANDISLEATGSGATDVAGDIDYWKVTTHEDGKLKLNFNSSNGLSIVFGIYSSNGSSLVSNYTSESSSIEKDGLAAGTYYIKVNSYYSTQLIPYSFTLNFIGIQQANDVEPNNLYTLANNLALNSTTTGHIGYREFNGTTADLEDWYKVTTTVDGKLTASVTSENGQNVYLKIYDGNGSTLLASAYTTDSITIDKDGLAPGEYYIKINTYYTNEFAPYTLTNELIEPIHPSEGSNNEGFESAQTFNQNSTINGLIGYRYNGDVDSEDWFSVTTNAEGELSIDITSVNGQNVYAQLFDGNGTTLLVSDYTTSTKTISKDGLAPGEYFIKVKTYYSSEFSPYILSNNLILPPHSTDQESNNDHTAAINFTLNSNTNGLIGYQYNGVRDAKDWYSVTTPYDGKLSLTVSSLNGQNVYVKLFDGNGTRLFVSDYTTSTKTIEKDGLAAGEYFVEISTYYNNEFAPYSLSNNLTSPPQMNDINNLANDSYSGAIDLDLNQPKFGHIGYRYIDYIDLADWYKLVLDSDQDLKISLKIYNNQPIVIQLFNSSGTTAIESNYSYTNAVINRTNLAAGTYYIKVYGYYTQNFAPYRLSTGVDTDDDGFADIIDCAPDDPNAWYSELLYVDMDGDGYHGSTEVVCYGDIIPEGYVTETLGVDCNDNDASINPGAEEICDGIDNNCDGNIDEGVSFTWYADADSDGYGDPDSSIESCDQPEGYVADNTDCDDTNPDINPGATEIPGNGIDENCDGTDGVIQPVDSDGDGIPDEVDNCPNTYNPDQEDLDGDGVGDACDPDIDGDGILNAEDCDPFDPEITTGDTWYADVDGDGYGDPNNSIVSCSQPIGYVTDNTDCDDTNPNINPGATEIPGNGIDENCDGTDGSTPPVDSDGDGIPDDEDNCPDTYNPDQSDANGDGIGDACEACSVPYMVELHRTSPTSATFNAGNSIWHYQGTANRAGRPLRPYPMYGMYDMTVPHTQNSLVPAFEYDVWLRTICPEGGYSAWAGPFLLPTHSIPSRLKIQFTVVPNPTKDFINFENIKVTKIDIYDSYGKLVLQQDVFDNYADLRQLQSGTYTAIIWDDSDTIYKKQIIKK